MASNKKTWMWIGGIAAGAAVIVSATWGIRKMLKNAADKHEADKALPKTDKEQAGTQKDLAKQSFKSCDGCGGMCGNYGKKVYQNCGGCAAATMK